MTAVDPVRAARGRSASSRGKSYERQFAAWLREHGWPDADRAVVTGWKAAQRGQTDPGDIVGCPDLVWDVKSRSVALTPVETASMLAAVSVMREGEAARYGFLVERVHRRPIGEWRAWSGVGQLAALVTGDERWVPLPYAATSILVRDLVALLHVRGFGQPNNPFADA